MSARKFTEEKLKLAIIPIPDGEGHGEFGPDCRPTKRWSGQNRSTHRYYKKNIMELVENNFMRKNEKIKTRGRLKSEPICHPMTRMEINNRLNT